MLLYLRMLSSGESSQRQVMPSSYGEHSRTILCQRLGRDCLHMALTYLGGWTVTYTTMIVVNVGPVVTSHCHVVCSK